tara:strand:- start:1881 stop:2345 length:465 start_codon:yes stop_codon:yes gene_type:complete
MSFTRLYDEPCRIKKNNQQSTDKGRYMLNVPGTGTTPYFMEDPYMRMEKWGSNLMTNSINLESDLKGLTRNLNRDDIKLNEFKTKAITGNKINYPNKKAFTDQSRATHPAWTTRDLEQVNWYYLPLDPQKNINLQFENNLSTRILEKDYYTFKA